MLGFRWQRQAALALLPFITACGSAIKSEPVGAQAAAHRASRAAGESRPPRQPPASPQTNVEAVKAVDPVTALIAASDRHFRTGQTELEQGHFEAAKQEFNLAVNVLLESPYGARTEPRIREHFDRLVDRISTYEIRALADGDGFTETKYEPATIDELLALSTTFGTPATTLELKDIVQMDLASTSHDVPIPLNQRVLGYVELFQGRLHDFIEDGLRRGSKYLPMIQNVFRAEGLPLDLAYVPLIESAFKPNALSRVKAKGVWQFMTGTAVENGLRRDWYIDERSDPEKATLAAIKTANLSDFWELAEKPRVLPRETREYVPMILAAIVIARNPAQYGFEFEPESALAYESITLPRPVDLRRVAEWTDTTIDEIQTLNPELRRWTTPVRDTQYELRVPPGTGDIVLSRLDASPTADLASLKYYMVKHGDTLALVARKLSVSKADLAEANYLPVSARLTAGDRLIVPHEAAVLMAARAERGVPVADARRTVNEAGLLAEATPTNRVRMSYQVQRGDTLASVARLFQTTVTSIKTWNPRLPSDRLTTGQRLTVYRLAD
jgi:membrane-bound lytic murein transglycosylase D